MAVLIEMNGLFLRTTSVALVTAQGRIWMPARRWTNSYSALDPMLSAVVL